MFKVGNFIFKEDEFAPECECGSDVYYLNIGRDHYWVCDKCKKYVYFGSNLLSTWRNQNKGIWERNKRLLSRYEEINDEINRI